MLLDSGYTNPRVELSRFLSETSSWNPDQPQYGSFLLSEAYYGKNPVLKKIEGLVENIRLKIIANPYYDATADKDNKEIERLFKSLFNFEEFFIQWHKNQANANAMTLPVGLMLTTSYATYDIKKEKNGIRFKDPKGKIGMFHSFNSLFSLTGITSAQWVAVMLHEIGHNFYIGGYAYVVKKLLIIRNLIDIIVQLGISKNPEYINYLINVLTSWLMATTVTGRKITINIQKFIEKYPALKNISDVISTIFAMYSDALSLMFGMINSFFIATGAWVIQLPAVAIGSVVNLIDSIIFDSYRDEKFADNFATSYGYGVELATTAQSFGNVGSMSAVEKFIQEIPVYNELYNANRFIIRSIGGIGECHPDDYQRVSDQAKMLRSELNKQGIPAEARKSMQGELEEIEAIYAKMNDSDYMKENHQSFEAFYNVFIKKMFNAERKDFKEAFLKTPANYNWKELEPQSER
jgi:hypothetical protein